VHRQETIDRTVPYQMGSNAQGTHIKTNLECSYILIIDVKNQIKLAIYVTISYATLLDRNN